jgi:O-antigen ligase
VLGGLAALMVFGVLTLWVRDRWAVAAFQCGVFGLAAWTLAAWAWRGGQLRWDWYLAGPAGAALLAAGQVWLGGTAVPRETADAAVTWLCHGCAAFLVLQFAADDAARRRLAAGFAWFAVAVAVWGVAQTYTSGGKVFWLFDSGYAEEVLGPFVYRNKFAQFIELAYPVALFMAIRDRRRTPLWLTAAAVLFASVVAAGSRMGFAVLVGETVVVLALGWSRGLISGKWALGLVLQTLALIGLWGLIVDWGRLTVRLFGLDPFEDHRVWFLESTWAMFLDRPWTGWGLQSWAAVYPEYALLETGTRANQAHCDWLQWASEGGILMVLLMLLMVGRAARPALRSVWGIGFLGVFVHGLLDYPMQQVPAFGTLVVAFGALVVSEGFIDTNRAASAQ